MKKLFFALIIFVSLGAQAQIYPDGTTINGFSATDIHSNFFSSTIANNAGKHIIIDISATWCATCWVYHGSKVLDRYYAKYGPNGNLAQDAEVMLYEGDDATGSNDLTGVGTNTVGDWVHNTNYLIFNESDPSQVISRFSPNGSPGFPSVFVVCPDKKMYRLSTNLTDENLVRDFVNQKCGLQPLSANSTFDKNFEFDVYPNPANRFLNIDIKLDKPEIIKYTIRNAYGQLINSRSFEAATGIYKQQIELASIPAGIYALQLQIGEQVLHQKIMISK